MISFYQYKYGGYMSKEFEKLMLSHEEIDRDYVKDISTVKERVKEEIENADEFLSMLGSDEAAAKAFFDYSSSRPVKFSVLPVRKSDRLYVKKHTATQRPYYHAHSFYELIFVQNGKCECFSYPDGARYRIDKGGVCLCAPGSVHALARAGKKDVILKAVVPAKIFEEMLGENTLIARGVSRVFDNAGDRAIEYFQNFTRENGDLSSFARIAEKKWLALFIVELFRDKYEKGGDIVEKFDIYAEKNLKGATLEGFARFAGYNPDYVTRVLKRETGKTFKDNVSDMRMALAKSLLKNTDMSVESVAAESGYQNASGLYKQFIATFGMTPTQYRKSQR